MAGDERAGEPARVHVGLLDYITATSVDQDYEHVSRRRAEAGAGAGGRTRPTGRPGRAALVVLLAFGLLVTTAGVQTARNAEETASSRATLVGQATARKATLTRQLREAASLRAEVSSAQARDLRATREGRAVQARLDRLGTLAGTSAVRGPGVRVVVDDAPDATGYQQQVQAADLVRLVNALWQIGAEAITVNRHRLTSLSAIRDAASAITVGFSSLRRPYVVSAVGNPDTMAADLLDSPGGQAWVTLQSTFGLQFRVDTEDSMSLPAATAPTLRSARPVAGPDGRSSR